MDRRQFLGTLSGATVVALAGCSNGTDDTPTNQSTPTDTETPTDQQDLRGAYVLDHKDEMQMFGVKSDGRLKTALMYAVPHEFYLTTGTRTQKVEIQTQDTMHLMVSVWDDESNVLPPSVEPSVTIYRDGEQQTTVNPWSMLSQQMGYHFGDNLQIRGEGNYRFEVELNSESSRLSGDLVGVFDETSFTFEQQFNPFDVQSLDQMTVENADEAGAIPPMDMEMMPTPTQPAFSEMPIEMTDAQYTNDMGVAVGTFDSPGTFGIDTEQYLVVSPQTRYNRYLMPLMSVEATVTRGEETLYDGSLNSSLHEDLSLFYGAGTPALEQGDTVSVSFNAPSQLARGLGYEEAFLALDNLEYTL